MVNTPHKDFVRSAFALLLIAHGVAHLIGFGHAWHLLSPDPLPARTTLFDQIDIGEMGMRSLGVVWLVIGLAFIVSGGAALLRAVWWMVAAATAATLSIVICTLAQPDANVGLVLDILIVMAVLVAGRLSLYGES